MYDDRNYSYDTIADQEEQKIILALKYKKGKVMPYLGKLSESCKCRVPRLNTLVFDKDVCLMCNKEIKP